MEVREYILADPEPAPIPRLQAELDAEVLRLCAGKQGESEIEMIYATRPGPVSRRWALMDLSVKRMGRSLKPHMKGCIELTAICMEHRVTLEVSYADRVDELKYGATAQREINLPLLNAERGPREFPPVGAP